MVRKSDSQATSVVEQTSRETGVLSVTRSSPGLLCFLQILIKTVYTECPRLPISFEIKRNNFYQKSLKFTKIVRSEESYTMITSILKKIDFLR